MAQRTLRALYLGRVSYAEGLAAQASVLSRLQVNLGDPSAQRLLLLEHSPVFTAGLRHHDHANDTSDAGQMRLRSLGADFHRCSRGGLLTFHGPGQLVAYPMLQLRQHFSGRAVKPYIEALQETIVKLCADEELNFGLPKAEVTSDVGVWMRGRKLAAIGVAVKRYLSSHGVAINCDVDLSWFDHIVPCGLVGRKATSFTEEVKPRTVSHTDIIPAFVRSFEEVFRCDIDLTEDVVTARQDVGLSAASTLSSVSV